MIKRILVALSGTPYTTIAVQYALELARAHGAEITGVTVSNVEALTNVGPWPIGAGAAAHELAEYRQVMTEERVEQAITEFEQACREASMIHCVDREVGDPFDQLTAQWRYHDLTILGLRGLFEYGVVQNPSDHLIQLVKSGVRPLLAVSEEYRPIKRVMIAYKGSMASAKAMKHFVQMRPWPDCEVRIVTARRDHAKADALLADAAAYCRAHDLDVETARIEDHPRTALLEVATEWNADLLVIGSRARSRMARYVLGDTALTCIRNAEIPLLVSR